MKKEFSTASWAIKRVFGQLRLVDQGEIVVIRDERSNYRLLCELGDFCQNTGIAHLWDAKNPISSTVLVLMEYKRPGNHQAFFGNHHHHDAFVDHLIDFVRNCTDLSEMISVFMDIKVAFDENGLKKKELYNLVLSVLKFLEPDVVAQLDNSSKSDEATSHAKSSL